MFVYVTENSIEDIETRTVSSGQEAMDRFEMFDHEGEFIVNHISTQEKSVNVTVSRLGYIIDMVFKFLDAPIEMSLFYEIEGRYVNYHLTKLGDVGELKNAVDNYFENNN